MDIVHSVSMSVDLGAIESEANMLFEQGQHEASIELLLNHEEYVANSSYLTFFLGRGYLYLGQFEEARTWLSHAATLHPVFPWVYYELARLHSETGDLTGAAGWMCRFLECRETVSYDAGPDAPRHVAPMHLSPKHREAIVSIAHRCFDVNKSMAVDLYRLLDAEGETDYLVQLRCAEHLIDAGQGKAAERKIIALQAHHPLDIWGLFALAKSRNLQADRSGALQVLQNAYELSRHDDQLLAFVCFRMIEIRCLSEVEHILFQRFGTAHPGDMPANLLAVYFRLAVWQRAHDRLTPIVDNAHLLSRIERWIVVEAVFELALPGDQITDADVHITARLVGLLEENPLSDLGTVLALFHFYARRRAWGRAERLNERLIGSPFENDREVQLRQFDYLCITTRLAEAEAFLQKHYTDRELGQWELCSVMRYYAEAKRWKDAGQTLLTFLSKGFYFPTGEFFLLQICRKSGIHEKVIEILDTVTPLNEAESKNLRQVVVDDLCVRGGVSALDGVGGAPARVPMECGEPNRVLIWSGQSDEDQGTGDNTTVFFMCTDRMYFFSITTLLMSYRVNNPPLDRAERWFVFVDGNVPAAWMRAVESMATAIGLRLTFVEEPEFVTTDIAHQDTYGIFTGGNTLSRAAFFRIYAARYLRANVTADRAIYFDSDIICRGDIGEFRNLPFDGQLLLARAEEFSPEIRDASVKNGLDPSRYFNSGVLQFNLRGVGMRVLIDEAVRLSECEPETLVFHDQCALNIAFFGRTKMLDSRYNFFIRPARPDNGDYNQGVLLHFLDKPKPWDVTYKREYRPLWSSHAAKVRALLPADVFTQIVAASNGHAIN